MKYAKTASFIAGAAAYALMTATVFAPSPQGRYAKLERIVARNPAKYEHVIDQAREGMHQLKAGLYEGATAHGSVDFGDVHLEVMLTPAGSSTILENKNTKESQPVAYINGRTAVGEYNDRLASVAFETFQKGKHLVIGEKEQPMERRTFEEQAREWYDSAKDALTRAYRKAEDWLKGNGNGKTVEPEQPKPVQEPKQDTGEAD